MAKIITFQEAVKRFESLVTTGISIEDAVREAVDRIYEMGRWPGTTAEVEIPVESFIHDSDLDERYVYFDEEVYNGAIGFRDRNRGWSIMDHTALYKDGHRAGSLEFIDYGTVNLDGVCKRKYRAPYRFEASDPPYFALMKLEAPYLEDQTKIPVQSVGALKCAILAVSYEYVNDEERANLNWQKFDQFIKLSSRQTDGPKRYYIGTDSSLRRRPNQFM